ncbi:MAG: glycoside hydrolase family 6 protein [Myxococcota bacterium]
MIRTALAILLLPGCFGLTETPSDDASDGTLPTPTPGPDARPDDDETGIDGDSGTQDSGGGADTGSGDPDDTGTDGPGDSPASDNPLAGLTLWVDPDSNAAREAESASGADAANFRKIAENPVAKWLGGWSGDVESAVRDALDEAEADGATRAFVVYNLPIRDCGGYSSGGASDMDEYLAWIDGMAAGVEGRPAVFVIEPDGLSMMDCLSDTEADERYAMIAYAVETLQAAGGIAYIDAGHSAWHSVDTISERLLAADVGSAAGFALNTSNFETTEDIVAYGEEVSAATGGAHFIADTARNGLGPTSDHEWCNPDGRALGDPSTLNTGNPVVDALLWIKAPGESDGTCNGGPSAGTWWPEYALGLASRASWVELPEGWTPPEQSNPTPPPSSSRSPKVQSPKMV